MEREVVRFSDVVKRVTRAMKKHLVLMLAIIIGVTALGVAYSFVKEPEYIASENAIYHAKRGEAVSDVDKTITEGYYETVLDFCKTNCVVDRANFYYAKYLEHRAEYKNVGDFLAIAKGVEKDSEFYYDESKKVDATHINKANISISASTSHSSTSYDFIVRYTDKDYIASGEKVKILLLAIEEEANVVTEYGTIKYFGVSVYIRDMGLVGITTTWTKLDIIAIAFIIGVLLSALVVYIVEISNKTVKNVKELEYLVGIDVLACIEG